MSYLLAALIMLRPHCKGHMHLSSKLLKAWKNIIPRLSATPFSPKIEEAFVAHLLLNKKTGSAAALTLSFRGYLRPNEALVLEWASILFPSDVRLGVYQGAYAGILVKESKTSSQSQFVPISDKNSIKLLQCLHKNNRRFSSVCQLSLIHI